MGGCVPRSPAGCPLGSFYRYCHVEAILERNPAANVRRPKVDVESRTLGLDRNELGGLLVQAALGSERDHALISLLALSGLLISEALGADITAMDMDRGHRTLAIVPIFTGANGARMDRYAADRAVKRLAKRAGITKRISPHSLRHSFVTAAIRAARDVQEAASHADPRTTMRYDRARQSLDRHATYIVAASSPAPRAQRDGSPGGIHPDTARHHRTSGRAVKECE